MNTPQASGNHVPGAGSPAAHSAGAADGSARRKRVWRIARVTILLLTLGSIVLFGFARNGKAGAAPQTTTVQHVVGPYYLHPGNDTDTPSINSPAGEQLQSGTIFMVECAAIGDPITNDGQLSTDGTGDYMWEYGTDESTGNSGWVSDQGLDTQINPSTPAQTQLSALAAQGIPACGSSSTAGNSDTSSTADTSSSSDASSASNGSDTSSSTSASDPSSTSSSSDASSASPAVSSGYNGQAAAQWALDHAKDSQPIYGVNPANWDEDCTWFASQAVINGGGLPQTQAFNLTSSYGIRAKGTPASWQAPSFVKYILATYPDSTWQELQFSQNSQPEAMPGDILAYDWDGNGTIDHLAVVVDDAQGTQYPEVSEWGNLADRPSWQILLGQDQSRYVKRGWTWSALDNNWIQVGLPHARVYLLHIVVASY